MSATERGFSTATGERWTARPKSVAASRLAVSSTSSSPSRLGTPTRPVADAARRVPLPPTSKTDAAAPFTNERRVCLIRYPLPPEQAGRPHGESREQDAERHRERPRGPEERGHQALDHAQDDGGHQPAAHAGQEVAERYADAAEFDRLPRVAGLHQPIVDAVLETEADLDDEEHAEEEHETAQRFFAAPLEAAVVDAVDEGAEQVEHRREQDPGEDRVEAVGLVHHVRRVRAEDEEGGLGDVGDVEQAEDERDAQAHGGIEAAE